jgi:hypothetical protein
MAKMEAKDQCFRLLPQILLMKAIFPPSNIVRDYAAGLPTAVKKWFLGPLGPEKIPEVSVLEADSFIGATPWRKLPLPFLGLTGLLRGNQ